MYGIHFFCFKPEKILLSKSGQQNQNCQFKLKFGTKTNLNMSNSMMMMLTFSLFDHKYPFWANTVQKFKIACSKWYFLERLIRLCKIQWWGLFHLFRFEIVTLFVQIWSKTSQLSVLTESSYLD